MMDLLTAWLWLELEEHHIYATVTRADHSLERAAETPAERDGEDQALP